MKSKLIIGAIASLLFVTPEHTRSQESMLPGYGELTGAELGARLCVNEGTWSELDCAAILHIRKRSVRRGEDFRAMLIRLHGDESRDSEGNRRPLAALRSDRVVNVHPRDGRPWIGDLTADGHRPAAWTDGSSWETNYRTRWFRILRVAAGVIAGTERDPCSQSRTRPNTWGDRGRDHDRAVRNGYEYVYCGATANAYWRQ